MHSQRPDLRTGSCLQRFRAIPDEFAGFVANPTALKRGGVAVQAARDQKRRGLLRWMAEMEVNRFWRSELVAREGE